MLKDWIKAMASSWEIWAFSDIFPIIFNNAIAGRARPRVVCGHAICSVTVLCLPRLFPAKRADNTLKLHITT